MSAKLRSVTVKLHPEMFKQISFMAQKRGETLSDTIRYLVNRGLEERIYEKNTDLLAKVVREQVEMVMKSYVIYPSLDDIENPSWAAGKLFNSRVNLCRINKETQTRTYCYIS
jgi:predicted double-glycine peptidase